MLRATAAVLRFGIGAIRHNLIQPPTEEMDIVMKARELPKQRALVGARKLVDTLSGPKVMFALSSSSYCAIHSLVIHDFSIYAFSGSLVFGAIAAMVVSWLSNRLSSSST